MTSKEPEGSNGEEAPTDSQTPTPRSEEDGLELVRENLDQPIEGGPGLARKKFRPWHKPRKQYVRLEQWCKEVGNLIAELRTRPGTFEQVSCLTLPADDFLDIRALHDTCAELGVSLRYLGFNELKSNRARRLESELSQAEVHKLTHIDGAASRLMNLRLQSVCDQESVGREAMHNEAPYDFINLDFCDSVVKEPPQTTKSALDAIYALLETQRASRTAPWLLFVTTRVLKEQIDLDVWEIIRKILEGNIASSESFKSAVDDLQLGAAADWDGDQEKFHRAFVIGFGKWLLRLAASAPPKWHVRLASSYGYTVHKPMDLLSLSFRFDLVEAPMVDPDGLVAVRVAAAPVEEPELATAMANEVLKCTDVDRLLRENDALLMDMTKRSKVLLASARYPEEEYDAWAAAEGAPTEG